MVSLARHLRVGYTKLPGIMKWRRQLLCVCWTLFTEFCTARAIIIHRAIQSARLFFSFHPFCYIRSLPLFCPWSMHTHTHTKIKSGTGRNNRNRNGDGEYIFIIFNITQNANVWLRNVKMCHCAIAAARMRCNEGERKRERESEGKKVDRFRMMWRYMCDEWIRFHYLMNVNGRVWLCLCMCECVCMWVVWWCTRLQRTARWNQSNRKIDGRRKKSYEIIIIIMMERRWRALLCAREKGGNNFLLARLWHCWLESSENPTNGRRKKRSNRMSTRSWSRGAN